MLPSRNRGRYSIFILFSLLVHISAVVAVLWTFSDEEENVKKSKTVTVQIKPKAEPKKSEPKKSEPKKSEPKKSEPKKSEPKKSEPKQSEPKKSEPKKSEPKKSEPKQPEPKYTPYQSSLDLLEQNKNEKTESLRKQQALPKFGSMAVLDDRELKQSVIYTKGYGNRFKKRELDGQRVKKSLSRYEMQKLNQHLANQVQRIFSSFDAPKKDGRKYYGEISILLDEDGGISHLTMKRPSGNSLLDNAVYETVVRTGKLSLPQDPLIRKAMVTSPLTLSYSDEDMAD